MEIFGIGPLELVLIVVIMLLVLGPKDMVATAGKIGRLVRQIVRSPIWGTVMQTSKEVRDLPTKIIREAGLEEDIAQIKEVAQTPVAMMNEAAKQLKVEIDPIELPKIPNPLSATNLPATTPASNPSTPPTIQPSPNAVPAPLAVDPIAPLSVESSPIPDAPATPLIVEPAEPPVDMQPEKANKPAPKRRTRRAKTDAADTVQAQTVPDAGDLAGQNAPAVPLQADLVEETPVTPRKPRRSRAKPTPLETEPLVIEPTSPHENGGSAKSG